MEEKSIWRQKSGTARNNIFWSVWHKEWPIGTAVNDRLYNANLNLASTTGPETTTNGNRLPKSTLKFAQKSSAIVTIIVMPH